jgi:hypothetical protein
MSAWVRQLITANLTVVLVSLGFWTVARDTLMADVTCMSFAPFAQYFFLSLILSLT